MLQGDIKQILCDLCVPLRLCEIKFKFLRLACIAAAFFLQALT